MTGKLEVLRVVYTRGIAHSDADENDYSWPLKIRYRVVETERGFIIQYQRPTSPLHEEWNFWGHFLFFDTELEAIESVNLMCFEVDWPELYYRRIGFL